MKKENLMDRRMGFHNLTLRRVLIISSAIGVLVASGAVYSNTEECSAQFYLSAQRSALDFTPREEDLVFVRNWVKANFVLIARGEKGDDLFATYVLIGEENKFEIDSGFLRICLVGRKYSGELLSLPGQTRNLARALELLREHALIDVGRSPEVVRVGKELGLGRESIFGVDARLKQSMQQSIDRAGRRKGR